MEQSLVLEETVWFIRIHTPAHLDGWFEDYFGELEICRQEDGSTLLEGELRDMPAVYGLLIKLRDSGLGLLSLTVEKGQKKEGTQ